MRKYTPLWQAMKKAYPNSIHITCSHQQVETIRNELAKEKSRDQDWPLRPYTKLQYKKTDTGLELWLAPYRVAEYSAIMIKTRGN